MINLTRPQYFIPVHGEYRHLTLHARLAREVGIPDDKIEVVENGQIICVDEKGVRPYGDVDIGRVLVDGKGVGDIGRSVLKERRILSAPSWLRAGLFSKPKPVICWRMPSASSWRSWMKSGRIPPTGLKKFDQRFKVP